MSQNITPKKKLIVIFASGGGSTAQALAQAIEEGKVNGQIVTVVCDNEEAGILLKLEFKDIETIVFDRMKILENYFHQYYPGGPLPQTWNEVKPWVRMQIMTFKKDWYSDVLNRLKETDAGSNYELEIFALGFTGKIPPEITKYFKGRIYNNHPAPIMKDITSGKGKHDLAPYTDGLKFYQDLNRETGIWQMTIHRVSDEFDQGLPLAELRFPIKTDITPEKLQNLTMIFEKWLTVFFAKTVCDKQKKDPLVIELPELSEIVNELKDLADVGETPFSKSDDDSGSEFKKFRELLEEVLVDNWEVKSNESLGSQMEEIKHLAEEYKVKEAKKRENAIGEGRLGFN